MKILGILHRQAMLIMRGRNRAVISRAPGCILPGFSLTRSSLISREEGGSLVEFALVLPMVLCLMTGIFAFSIVLDQKLQLDEAVSAGGRFLALERGDTDPCKSTASLISNSAPSLTPGSLNFTFVISGSGGGTYTGTVSTVTCPISTTVYMTQKDNAQVTVTYPYELGIYWMKFTSGKFSTSVTEATQ